MQTQRKQPLRNSALFMVAAFMILVAVEVGAQSPPPWPTQTPAASKTPTPSPTPEPVAPPATPSQSVSPSQSDGGESSPTAEPNPSGESGGEQPTAGAEVPPVDDESAPKSEQVTNPGAVAFTDYRPFDLEAIEPQTFDSKWKGFVAGVRGISRYNLFDGKLKFRIGSKIQVDGTAGNGNGTYEAYYSPVESKVSLRNITLYAVGRLKDLNFNVSFDFGADWGIDATWIEGAKGGLDVWGHHLGKLRLGLVYEPFSLERQNSSYNGGFMERSLPVTAFAPGTNIGAKIHDSSRNGRISWAAGLFSFGQSTDQNAGTSLLSLTGRFTYLPVYRDEGRHLVHVGASFSSRSPSGGDTQYRTRPEARFVDYLVDTGSMPTNHIRLWGLEFAAVRGPLWMMAEYIQSDVSAQSLDDPSFAGSYVQFGWFLTGETRPYRTNSGTFDRVLPIKKYSGGNPFKKKNGGAWELAGRISTVDLTDGLVEGGELTDFDVALSWHVNATTRVELNYIYADPKDHGAANIVLLRLQYQPW